MTIVVPLLTRLIAPLRWALGFVILLLLGLWMAQNEYSPVAKLFENLFMLIILTFFGVAFARIVWGTIAEMLEAREAAKRNEVELRLLRTQYGELKALLLLMAFRKADTAGRQKLLTERKELLAELRAKLNPDQYSLTKVEQYEVSIQCDQLATDLEQLQYLINTDGSSLRATHRGS